MKSPATRATTWSASREYLSCVPDTTSAGRGLSRGFEVVPGELLCLDELGPMDLDLLECPRLAVIGPECELDEQDVEPEAMRRCGLGGQRIPPPEV